MKQERINQNVEPYLKLILNGRFGPVGHLGRIPVIPENVLEAECVLEVIHMDIQKLHNLVAREIVMEIQVKQNQNLQAHTAAVIL